MYKIALERLTGFYLADGLCVNYRCKSLCMCGTNRGGHCWRYFVLGVGTDTFPYFSFGNGRQTTSYVLQPPSSGGMLKPGK